jgi:hypothetical protein
MNLRCVVNIPQASLNSGTTYNIACGSAPSNQRIAVSGFGYFGGFNAAATPGLWQFARASSQGSSGTALTIKTLDDDDTETPQSSWITQPSTPPSSIVVIDSRYVNPQLGLTELWDADNYIEIKGGGFFVVQFTPQQTTNYAGWLRIIE